MAFLILNENVVFLQWIGIILIIIAIVIMNIKFSK
jgi:drug/metabolite transporter (DMT)-like permease